MPCEHYKDALIEAAATGSDFASAVGLSPELATLRAHLAVCASCRAAFAEEESLFAAIDSDLHAAANADVPPSLLPRVRVGLDGVAVAHTRWGSGWFALAGAAAAATVLSFAVTIRHNPRTPLTNSATYHPPTQQVIPSTHGVLPSGNPHSRHPVSTAGNPVVGEALLSQKSVPEALVPRDQEFLLAAYARQWGARQRAPLLPADADLATVTPLEVAPIQITQLDVKPLAEGDSQ
jgi:hypothetical protein